MILAGGKGTRMLPLTKNLPKPMIEVAGKPFLEHLILQLKSNGIEEVTILLGYMGDKVVEYFRDGSEWNLKIQYSIGKIDDRTGTRIRNAQKYIKDNFLLLYCDNYCPLDLKSLNSFFTGSTLSTSRPILLRTLIISDSVLLV